MRRIVITFTSKNFSGDAYRTLTIGGKDDEDPSISIRGSKYLALTKDKGTITIKNLEYKTIAEIMAYELYKIEINVGYGSTGNLTTIAKGEVSYISQKPNAKKDTETYIYFA